MKQRFSGQTMKEAYMKAVKWVSTNVISKEELKDVLVSFEKSPQGSSPIVTVTLHTFLDEKAIKERHCEICRETHKSFFINENCNCDWCLVAAFQRRADDMLKVKVASYRNTINTILEEQEWDG